MRNIVYYAYEDALARTHRSRKIKLIILTHCLLTHFDILLYDKICADYEIYQPFEIYKAISQV